MNAPGLPPVARPPHDPLRYRLDRRAGWRSESFSALAAGVAPSPGDGALALVALPGSGALLNDPGGSFGGLDWPDHLAPLPDGGLVLLDRKRGRLRRFDRCACRFSDWPCLGTDARDPRRPLDPGGIAIGCGQLWLCDTGHRRVLVFGLASGSVRATWPSPALPGLAAWQPEDVALIPGGELAISDPANGGVHLFSVYGTHRRFHGGLGAVRSVASDLCGRVYLRIEGTTEVIVLDPATGRVLERPVRPEEVAERFAPLPVRVLTGAAVDVSALCACPPEPALIIDASGEPVDAEAAQTAWPQQGSWVSVPLDSEIARCTWHRVVLAGSVPPGTRVQILSLTAESEEPPELLALRPDDAWQLAGTWQGGRRPDERRSGQGAGAPGNGQSRQGAGAFDKGQSRQDACPPDKGRTMQGARAPGNGQSSQRGGDDEDEQDYLLRSPPGRYLWLKLVFSGDGTATPRLRAIELEFPRISLRRYLPAVFGAEPVAADFTDRWLALFDRGFRDLESVVDRQAHFFDPLACPAAPPERDFLSWLASWVGVALPRSWPEARRRSYLRHAPALFAWRGTPAGLRRTLYLFLGLERWLDYSPGRAGCVPCPLPLATQWRPPRLLLEHFQLRRWMFLGKARLSDNARLWGERVVNRSRLGGPGDLRVPGSNPGAGGARLGVSQLKKTQDPCRDPFHVYAHKLSVFVPAACLRNPSLARALQRLVDLERPAHVQVQVVPVEPRFRVGVQAMLGLDAVIGWRPQPVQLDEGQLGRATVLTSSIDEHPRLRVGDARIGEKTVLP